jgi:hypothetical protein
MPSRSRFIVLAAALLLHQSAGAQELADLNKPITLDLPGLLPFVTSTQPIGGWSLTVRMLANKPIGIGSNLGGIYPPYGSRQGWIVWADPDGKFSFGCNPQFFTCPPHDETYLEFNMGLTSQGSAGPPLQVNTYDPQKHDNSGLLFLGPPSGGYGKSSAVPGLVILSDTGVGREFTLSATTGIEQTGRARNIAGFVDSVAWTANDHMPFVPRTSVTAQMNVPYGMFKPILFVDYGSCPMTTPTGTIPAPCTTWKWSIEGHYTTGDTTAILASWRAIVTTIRIFVLDGPAPDLLEDLNHDGVIDARDALLAVNPVTSKPYRLLSGERVIKFKTLEQEEFPGIPFDFDGDGMVQPPAPASAGGIVRVPP